MSQFKGFTSVELRKPTRSTFDLSHEKRVSTRMGKLTPILCVETLPNDTFYGSTEVLCKIAPMLAPIFHRLNLYVHFFFVPNRLLWKDWETFITGGRLGEAVTSPPVPPNFRINEMLALNSNFMNTGSWCDYLGIPPIPDGSVSEWSNRTIDAMPLAALHKVYYDYYRDRNYEADHTLLPMNSGLQGNLNIATIGTRRYRCWQHDYFTSAMISTQRGAEVLMPMEGSGTITYKNISDIVDPDGNAFAPTGDTSYAGASGLLTSKNIFMFNEDGTTLDRARVENLDSVDFENSSVSINDLRRAVALQQYLERNQLAGSRYTEWTMAHFARKSSDARLQRAEYLGGGKAVLQVSEVMTTAYSEDAESNLIPPANPSGRASSYSTTNRFSYNCEEHGFIVGFLSVMPTSGYMQGIPRMFQQRNTFLDYPIPTFANLGEQEVYDNEIYMTPTSMPVDRTTQPVFGYQSRYSDWKNIPSSSHGDFRTTLDYWHLTRKFSAQPDLGIDFVHFEDSLQDRIFPVAEVDTLWMYIYNKLSVKRSLPYFGTPGLNRV